MKEVLMVKMIYVTDSFDIVFRHILVFATCKYQNVSENYCKLQDPNWLRLSTNFCTGLHSLSNKFISSSTYRSVVMAHCYYTLVWIAGTCATAPPDNSVEQGLRRMAVLR